MTTSIQFIALLLVVVVVVLVVVVVVVVVVVIIIQQDSNIKIFPGSQHCHNRSTFVTVTYRI